MELNLVLVGVVLFFSAFTQSVSGFGVALVAMALLPLLIDVQSATALVALVVIVVDVGVLARYYKSLRFGDVWLLLLPSFVGVPLGIFLLRYIEESVILMFLGFVLV